MEHMESQIVCLSKRVLLESMDFQIHDVKPWVVILMYTQDCVSPGSQEPLNQIHVGGG